MLPPPKSVSVGPGTTVFTVIFPIPYLFSPIFRRVNELSYLMHMHALYCSTVDNGAAHEQANNKANNSN